MIRLSFLFFFLILHHTESISQDRYVVSPGKESRVIPQGKSALEVARAAGWTDNIESVAGEPNCVVTGGPSWIGGVNFGFSDGDVCLMRLLAPMTGVVETVYFSTLGVSSQDSTCIIRIFESAFTSDNPEPTGTVWLGYYDWPSDPHGEGVAPFGDTPGVTGWVVGDSTASPTGFDPNGKELSGQGGYVTTFHSHTINSVVLAGLGKKPVVTQGDYFNVTLQFPSQLVSDGERREIIATSEGNDPFDFLKFYYRGRLTEEDRGWWAREFNVDVWVVVCSDTSRPAPLPECLTNTLSTDSQMVCIGDNAAIESAELCYSVDGGPDECVPMLPPDWCAIIPGMEGPARILYSLMLTDTNGIITETTRCSYRIVNLNQSGYTTDYNAPFNWVDISATGTAIPLSDFFDFDGSSQDADDGTAGPFDVGGEFIIFGDTARYAWIGVNGAIALSMSPFDTTHVNSGGFFTNWEIPDVTIPPNFVSGFWNDHVLDPNLGGHGTIYYQNLGTKLVVQYDSVANLNYPNDLTTFQIILDRTDPTVHKVSFQYRDVGITGQELTAMTGLQGKTSGPWLLVCQGAPEETRPANAKAIIMFNDNPTGIRPGSGELPGEFVLFANYPNPFNPTTTIRYELPEKAFVTLAVYNILGEEVATLVNEEKEVGSYQVRFDGRGLASGVYLYRLSVAPTAPRDLVLKDGQANDYFEAKKLVLLK